MPMSDEERADLMEKVMAEPLPPLQELMDKWIKPAVVMDKWIDDEYLPEGIRNEPGDEVIGPDLIPDDDAEQVDVELEPAAKAAIKRRILERGSESLQARVAAATAELDRKGKG